jgi:hypothetical protein
VVAPSSHTLDLAFDARGLRGSVSITVSENTSPTEIGCGSEAHGFPVCEAVVRSQLRGYNSLLGWVQLVGTRVPGSATVHRFEVDPLQIFEGLDMPFGFYGLHPTLFDAPSRRDRTIDLDWLAHTFLCVSPIRPMERAVEAVAAFRWGFTLVDRDVRIVDAQALPLDAWNDHLELLRAKHPTWRFIRIGE